MNNLNFTQDELQVLYNIIGVWEREALRRHPVMHINKWQCRHCDEITNHLSAPQHRDGCAGYLIEGIVEKLHAVDRLANPE